MWRGIIADLPIPPMKIRTSAHVITDAPMNIGAGLLVNIALMPSAVVKLTWLTFAIPSTGADIRTAKMNVPV